MRLIIRISFLLSAFLCCGLVGFAQSVELTPPQINDPCGDPSRESMLWEEVAGKVVQVIDGDTIVISREKKKRVLVHLVGIDAPAINQAFGREAQQFLENAVLGKVVSVLVNPSNWIYKKPRPKEISGVVHLPSGEIQDVNLALIQAGMARHKNSESYTMSNYTECQYKNVEAEARTSKRGLWQSAA